jgi:hypothetical protein
MMNSAIVYLLGMTGALAPEIVRLYSIRQDPSRFQWSWFYLAVSIAFGALGGVMALILPATTYWGALYVGVSTPVLVTTMVKTSTQFSKSQLKHGSGSVHRYSLVNSYIYGL